MAEEFPKVTARPTEDDEPRYRMVPKSSEEVDRSDWEKSVRSRYRDRCASCGSEDRLRVKLAVPHEAGGTYTETNGVLLCRACEMASEAVKSGGKQEPQRLVNFWLSAKLFQRIEESLESYCAFNSMGALIRYLIDAYVEDPTRWDDLELYQDEESDVKINVWVEKSAYFAFRELLGEKGATVTETLRQLLLAYFVIESERVDRLPPKVTA